MSDDDENIERLNAKLDRYISSYLGPISLKEMNYKYG